MSLLCKCMDWRGNNDLSSGYRCSSVYAWSTITESFFRRHLKEHAESIVDVSPSLRISVAQWLEIPFVSYIELPIGFLGHTFSAMEFLIVWDPVGIASMVR